MPFSATPAGVNGVPPAQFLPPPVTVQYAPGYSQAQLFGTGPGNLALLDANTGLSQYSMANQGRYVVAVDVAEYRTIDGTEVLVGRSRRDVQLVVRVCPAGDSPRLPPPALLPRSYTLEEGDWLSFPIDVTVRQLSSPLTMKVNSALLDGAGGRVASFHNSPGAVAAGQAASVTQGVPTSGGIPAGSVVEREIGFELVRQLYRQNFDPAFSSTAKIDYAIGIPLTHIGLTEPVLPIYVNAYLPPQPTMERCYAFGQAVARTVTAMGLKTVILSSGGMSHFPGTDRYGNPELAWDNKVLEKLAAGKLKSLIGFDETELDDTGNIELRCWACAAGALGERKPDIVSMDPSWHHNYASLGWYSPPGNGHAAHYPSIKPELVELTSALHALAHEADSRTAFVKDAGAYADGFKLTPEQRQALIAMDLPAIVKMGAHPLVPFLANMQIQRLRR